MHNPSTYLPTYLWTHKFSLAPPSSPSRPHHSGCPLSPQTTNMLQALKRLFNICRGARSIYVESVHKSRYVRTPRTPTVEFVKVAIQPADFNPLRNPEFETLLVFMIHRAISDPSSDEDSRVLAIRVSWSRQQNRHVFCAGRIKRWF